MDIVDHDQELAQDVLKLLHVKLQEARQQLHELERDQASSTEGVLLDSSALQRENDALKEELSALQFRLSAAAGAEDSKQGLLRQAEKHELELERQSQIETLRQQAEAETQKLQRLEAQVNESAGRYKEAKDDRSRMREELTTLEDKLRRKQEGLLKCQVQVQALESELCKLGPPPGDKTLDVTTFLQDRPSGPADPAVQTLQPLLQSTPFTQLPDDIIEQFGQLPLLILPAEEVLWSNDKIGRALYVTCDRRYDPIAQKGGGQWQDNKLARALMEDPTSVRELFYRLKDHWYYYGTYRVAGRTQLSTDQTSKLKQSVVRNAINATVSHKGHIAPVALKFVCSSFSNGPLSLQCLGFERVGFNHELYNALLASKKAIQRVNSSAALGIARPELQTKHIPSGVVSSSGSGPSKKRKRT
ncbi:hypothetical protein C8Q70DRAFT_960707 [Cubamyces menziesii]|nr:hypothetical protein C8Q70DRAFT_960707 [Cubamyces menziesii]